MTQPHPQPREAEYLISESRFKEMCRILNLYEQYKPYVYACEEVVYSHPRTPALAVRPSCVDVMAEIEEARKSERERVLQLIHKKTFAMRHRASSEEVNNEAVILDYSAVYELLQSLRGGGAP